MKTYAGISWPRGILPAAALAVLAVLPPGLGALPEAVSVGEDREGVGWYEDLGVAQSRARQTGRPLFLYFDAAWCSWCHRYERGTLSSPRVQRVLRRRTVPVRLDWDARRDLVSRFGGRGLPFNVLLAPDGRLLGAYTGILPPAGLIALVREAHVMEPEPAGEEVRPRGLDREAYRDFRAAFLDRLDRLFAPDAGTLAGRHPTGAGLKRSQPLTWMWLQERAAWDGRAEQARLAEVERLLDPVDGGFFYYVDPHRPGGHRETAKLVEHNAWMVAWLSGAEEVRARLAALSGWFFLQVTLWDEGGGGFWRACIADADYYGLSPAQRLPRPAPAVDRAKLADANAQAALALLRAAEGLDRPVLAKYAHGALDFVLEELLHEGRLYHIRRGGERAVADLPADLLWVLIAGDAVQRRDERARREERLAVVARIAGDWLRERMAAEDGNPPRTEVAALAARACSLRARYPDLPAGCQAWALRRLTLRPDTRPDWLIPGLRAWEARLGEGAGGTFARR